MMKTHSPPSRKSNEVVEMVKQNVSLMPDAILKEISAQDAADLLEYLTTLR